MHSVLAVIGGSCRCMTVLKRDPPVFSNDDNDNVISDLQNAFQCYLMLSKLFGIGTPLTWGSPQFF